MGKRIVIVMIVIIAMMFSLASCAETPKLAPPVGTPDREAEDKAENEPETEDVTEDTVKESYAEWAEAGWSELIQRIESDQWVEVHSSLDQYSFTSADGDIQYRFSGVAMRPDVDKIPLLLGERRYRTSEEIEKICRVLCGDAPIYEYSDDQKLSTFEIMPDSYWVERDWRRGTGSIPDEYSFSMCAVSEINGIPMILKESQGHAPDFWIDNFYYYPNTLSGLPIIGLYQMNPITDDDAERNIIMVEEVLDKMDIGTWKCTKYWINGGKYNSLQTEWTHYISGIPVLRPRDDFRTDPFNDNLTVGLSSDRIRAFTVRTRLGVGEKTVLDDNVEILPFDEIMDHVVKQLEETYTKEYIAQIFPPAYDLETGLEKPLEGAILVVNGLELGYARIDVPGSDTEFHMVPAWAVKGIVFPEADDSWFTDERIEEAATTLLCINAIDGSVIDVSKGY